MNSNNTANTAIIASTNCNDCDNYQTVGLSGGYCPLNECIHTQAQLPPFEQGQDAYVAGMQSNTNPYSMMWDMQDHMSWSNGYRDAQQQDQSFGAYYA